MPPSSIAEEPLTLLDLLSHLRCLSSNPISHPSPFIPTRPSAIPLNSYIDGFVCSPLARRHNYRAAASCGLSGSSSKLHGLWSEFNRFVRIHCDRPPIGFASIGLGVLPNDTAEPPSGEEGPIVLEDDAVPVNGVELEAPKKVLILMSDTGGGHRASAEAIKAAFNQEFGDDYQVFVTDLWTDHTPWPFNQLPRSYNFLVKHGTLWKMTYYGSAPRTGCLLYDLQMRSGDIDSASVYIDNLFGENGTHAAAYVPGVCRCDPLIELHDLYTIIYCGYTTYGLKGAPFRIVLEPILMSLCGWNRFKLMIREVAKGLMKYQPDIIISVHPLMQHVPLKILRAKGLLEKIVFTTVVTDLSTCHPTWFHKLVTRCYCPSTEVAKRALKAGLQPSQIKVYGLPVRPSFVKPVQPKDVLRRELGMDEDLPAVLLMGGGEGMGPIEATAQALGNTLYDENLGQPIGQILVICGRNKKLYNRLQSIDWKVPVQVKGFVTKMEECMGACDCIITKAGPGTIAEAMIRGLPIILNGYIAGQMPFSLWCPGAPDFASDSQLMMAK
ncbi:Monogalactosyldiacylglycerol synthase 1, chloroplastic [Cocos nucifera]|uniref:monogalactosyldiacylglycerol synthase n=1 Tax=Cocos nucifera TaxID=13894 RepID=A0A8K0HUL6_COCNU|nr:Monogalactosyldiacylglycerol synthase 1, chloroplastic [Cocos nucifera]